MKTNLHLLATVRRKKKVSQHEMAIKLGYKTKGAYNKIEKGVVELRLNQARVIAKTLKLSKDEVFDIFFENHVAI